MLNSFKKRIETTLGKNERMQGSELVTHAGLDENRKKRVVFKLTGTSWVLINAKVLQHS